MIVIEIQHYNNGRTDCITTTHANQSEAEQKYHTILAAASVSNVDVHSAVMLNDDGTPVKHEPYYHGSLTPEA